MIPGIVAAGAALIGDVAAPVPDATFADVVLQISWDGADNATSATDVSNYGHTIAFHGNAKLDTTQKVFGPSSLELDGAGDYNSVPNHAAFHFGSGPFCIEGFTRPTASAFQDSTIIGMWTLDGLNPQAGWRVAYVNEGLSFQYSVNGNTIVTALTASLTLPLDTWTNWSVQRNDSGLMELRINGVVEDTATSDDAIWESTLDLTIGANFDTVVAGDISAWIDSIRVTRNWYYIGDVAVPTNDWPPAPVEGTLSAIEGADLAAFEGPLIVEGTLAATEGADVAAFTGPVGLLSIPEGRITLTTAVPVLTATVSAATTIYYTPYIGNQVPLYDGSTFAMTDFAELSQTTSDATKSPAAVTTNSNYDMFVWDDSGTIRCTRGPLWTSDTVRGTGAGTTELERVNGILLNKVSITNGPAAQRGTYVGTVRSNASSQISFIFGTTDTAAVLNVWNAHNRVEVVSRTIASVNSFTMVSNSVRSWNNSAVHRAGFVSGLAEDAFTAEGHGMSNAGTTTNRATGMGIGYDSTSAISGTMAAASNAALAIMSSSSYATTAIGAHFVQALEVSQTNANNIGYGDAGIPLTIQAGLTFRFMM